MKFKLYLPILLLLVPVFLFSSQEQAITELIVAYTDWYPYTYCDLKDEQGFEIEIFNSVMEIMNIEVTYIQYPWKRCLSEIENGSVDALVSALKTSEREKYMLYPQEHISVSETVIFTLKQNNINYTGSLDDLKDYKIGLISGFSYGEEIDSANHLMKDYANNARNLIHKVVAERHEIGIENKLVITAYALSMDLMDDIKFIYPPIHTQKLYVGLSKKNISEEFSQRFSKALKDFKQTKKYAKILNKYGLNY